MACYLWPLGGVLTPNQRQAGRVHWTFQGSCYEYLLTSLLSLLDFHMKLSPINQKTTVVMIKPSSTGSLIPTLWPELSDAVLLNSK